MQAWDIEFRSLTVGYGEHVVLRDINAVLPRARFPSFWAAPAAANPRCSDISSAFRGLFPAAC